MFKFSKKTDDNGSVKTTITEKEIREVLFKNFDSKLLPKKYLLNNNHDITDDDINYDYTKTEVYWVAAYIKYLEDEMCNYIEKIKIISDEKYNYFIQHLKKAEPLDMNVVLTHLNEIVENAPKITDEVEKTKNTLDAITDIIFRSKILGVTIGALVVECKDCNSYAYK